MKNKILVFIALVACSLSIGCQNPMSGNETEDASFTITINGGNGRAAVDYLPWERETQVASLDHTITMTNSSGVSIQPRMGVKAGQHAQFKVAPGHWNITVYAYLGNVLKAVGYGEADLKPGPNETVNIKMGQPDKETYPITMQTDGHGTATAEPNQAAAGDTVMIHARPHDGYMFEKWSVISGGVGLSDTAKSTAEFTMPSNPVVIKAEFNEVPPDTPVLSMTTVEFTDVTYGYSQPSAQTVTIHNSGNMTADVRVTISGMGASSFILGGISTSTIAAGANATFTVRPNAELGVGVYAATITATYSGGVVTSNTETIDVSFTVHAIVINTVEIGIIAPVNGIVPDTKASGSGSFTIGPVSWEPSHDRFLGEKVYKASVTLTANAGHTFNDLTHATINGEDAERTDNTGSSVTLSYTFPETDSRVIKSIAVKTQPTNMSYTHGDVLNLTGLVITLTYDDGSTEEVAAADFGDRNITAEPSHGGNLIHNTHDGYPIKITYGVTCETDVLTVGKAEPKVADFDIYGIGTFTYNGNPKSVSINPKDGKSDGYITIKYDDSTTLPSAAGTYNVTFDVTEATNYTAISGLFAGTLTINPAVIDIADIPGITAPVHGETPVTAISTAQYSGTVSWSPQETTFKIGTVYTATITLTADDNYTMQGIELDFFTIEGATSVSCLVNNANTVFVTAVFPETPFNVYSEATWTAAKNAINSGGSGTTDNYRNYTINITQSFSMSSNTSNTFNSTYINVTITGDHTITLTGTGNLLRLGANQSVVIHDTDFVGYSDNNTSLIYVYGANARLTMEGNSSASNNINSSYGGGVYVNGSSAIFTMKDEAWIYDNIASYGGGVAVIDTGTFNMSGNAKITGNISTVNNVQSGGGGVYVGGAYAPTFIMSGGTISGNNAVRGGGVYVYRGIFRMETGTIYGTNETETILQNTSPDGATLHDYYAWPNVCQYGTFSVSGDTSSDWNRNGDLLTTNNTLNVVNGKIPITIFNAAADAGWSNAVNTIKNNGYTDVSYTINVIDDITAPGTDNNTFGAATGLTVNIIGNDHTITLSSHGSLLRIGANQTVFIRDTNFDGNKGSFTNNTALIDIDSGSLTMDGNSSVSNNNGSDSFYSGSGGVYVGSSATFTMLNGTISGNTSGSTGGGVYINGTFNMKGGTISGNSTTYVYGGDNRGGGVYQFGGTFRLETGTIYGNESVIDINLQNTVSTTNNGTAYYRYRGTAQRGTFSGDTWNSLGDLSSSTSVTINVVNGVEVPLP